MSLKLLFSDFICVLWQELFQDDIMWLRDTGVLNKMKNDVLNLHSIPAEPLPRVWKDKPLNLTQLGITMILFVCGVASSLVVFFYEVRQTNKHKTATSQSKSLESGEDGQRRALMPKFAWLVV